MAPQQGNWKNERHLTSDTPPMAKNASQTKSKPFQFILPPAGQHDHHAQATYIMGVGKKLIRHLGNALKMSKIAKTEEDKQIKLAEAEEACPFMDIFLSWLENDVSISSVVGKCGVTPDFMKLMLESLLTEKGFAFPTQHTTVARSLRQRWEAENWGRIVIPVNEQVVMFPTLAAGNTHTAPSGHNRPKDDHPIWGKTGIMYGAERDSDGKIVLRQDLQARDFRVHGHNDLVVGRWFPRQMLAHAHGAHGSARAGISGNTTTGAYSIVISGTYNDLDKDLGDTIYYSGSNSHENRDPNVPAPSTLNTMMLQASLRTGYAVRVLRGHNYLNPKCPKQGIRYDGVYKVVDKNLPKNQHGGLYEQFELERLPGQRLLTEIITPTREQLRDLAHISDPY